LSETGRDILRTKLEEFKQSNNMKKWTNIQACPLRLSGAFFWSYIEYKLKEDYTNINNYKKAMKGELFENKRLIRNIKLKKNNESINGGSITQTVRFLNQLFTDDYGLILMRRSRVNKGFNSNTLKTQLLHRRGNNFNEAKFVTNNPFLTVISVRDAGDNFSVPEIITIRNYKYKLFGATLNAFGNRGGHAMTGYLCGNGKYMFYDSNNIRTSELDWTKNSFWRTEFKEYLKVYFANLENVGGDFFYVRQEQEQEQKIPITRLPWYKKLFN
jgi:hypothetical protein